MLTALQWIACLATLPLGAPQDQSAPDRPAGPPPGGGMMSPAEAGEPRGLVANAEGAFQGYTLVSPLSTHRTVLVDMDGQPVHEWKHDSTTASGMYLLEDGTLLRGGREDAGGNFNGGGIGGKIQRVAPDGSLVWSYSLAIEDRWLHHDIEPLPNGNVLAIIWERMSAAEAVSLGRDPAEVGKAGFWTDSVIEIRPTLPEGGEIVWTWRSRDHLVQDFDAEAAGFGSILDHPARIDINGEHRDQAPMTAEQLATQAETDRQLRALGYAGGEEDEQSDGPNERRDRSGDWLHTNAVAYMPEYDLIALSTPHFDEIWIIDHSTSTAEAAGASGGRWGAGGDLLWRWGNPRMYGHGSEDDRQLFYQHNPTFLDYGGGELGLLLFNNGRDRGEISYSSVDELVLPFSAESGFYRESGEPFGPEGPDWSYAPGYDTFYSAFISGAQRLPNGNTLICSGVPGHVFEITSKREVVWDFKNPWGDEITVPEHAPSTPKHSMFRSTRIGSDHPGLEALLD